MLNINCLFKTCSQIPLLGILILSGTNSWSQPVAAQSAGPVVFQVAQNSNFPSNQEIYNAYFNAGYGYCDAQMLGAFWGKPPAEAKFLAGKALLRLPGFSMNIPGKLIAARRMYTGRGVCNFSSDFSYQDAFALAAYWNVPIDRAKSALTSKLESGNLRLARSEVKRARRSTTAFKNLDRSGDILGYYTKKIDGNWVEKSASGQDTFSFREVRNNSSETTLVDDSRGVEIRLNRATKIIYYRELNSGKRAVPLYSIQP